MRAAATAAALAALLAALAAPARAATPATEAAPALAIVVRDPTPLRAGPHEAAPQQALLWQGEVLEVRGERLDYLQVWDYGRERGGFVEAGRVRRTALAPADAPGLLAVVRFVRETPGAEALGIGFAAAYLKAATPEMLRGEGGAEAFDAIGTMAERMAQRASAIAPANAGGVPSRAETAASAHLEVAVRYGVAFKSFERDGAMRLCYDGEAFARVLAMASGPAQRARAALGLTRPECIDPQLPIGERQRLDAWRAEVLDRVDAARLPGTLRNRIAMRRAGVWSGLAFQEARRGDASSAAAAARRALSELASVDRADLADEDQGAYDDAAIRVGASRWAAAPTTTPARTARNVGIVTAPGEAGQTCVVLVDAKHDVGAPLARRCTFGLVWAESASLDREGNALALAVQPMDAWRELWLFTREGGGWTLQVLPPATATSGIGYIELAGWVPGGKQLLVAREARGDGRLKRSFEVVRLDTLTTARQSSDPSVLGPFQRWLSADWKRETVSLR
jgi:hypothetical protein